MYDQITIAWLGIRAGRSGIDAQNAVRLLNRGAVRMPVKRNPAAKFLSTRRQTGKPALDPVLMPVTAQDRKPLRLDHALVLSAARVAISFDQIRFFRKRPNNFAKVPHTVAEVYQIIVLPR